jgi:hypothetical protein
VIYIRTKVDESPAWVQGQVARKTESRWGKDILTYLGPFAFLVVLMFAFNSFSHGSQDLYPTFLTKDHKFTSQTVGFIAVIANIGALLGGILFGTWSEKIGRRKAIVIAALLSIPIIPLWAYAHRANAGTGRFPDAIHGAGGVGCDSRTLERTFACCGTGNVSGVRLPTGESSLLAQPGVAGQDRRAALRWIVRAGAGVDTSDRRDFSGGGHGERPRAQRR